MKKHHLLTLATALTILASGAYAQSTAPQEPGQAAYQATPSTPGATSLVTTTTPDIQANVTTTVERTDTKTYTVKTRRVGIVGYHPYPLRHSTKDGGATMTKFVNGQEVEKTIIAEPDPSLNDMLDQEALYQPYYTDDIGEYYYGEDPLDLKIQNNGNYNR